jgi:PrcB C-terminal
MKRILFFCLLLVASAGVSVLLANQKTQQEGTPVPFTGLDPKQSGPDRPVTTYSGITKPLRVVIRDQDGWREFWKELFSRQQPVPPLPDIDFSREMLIVVAMGERNTGGFTIMVDAVYEKEKKLQVFVKSTGPGKNCMVTQALTQPVDIVRVLKSDHEVVFRETSVSINCGL